MKRISNWTLLGYAVAIVFLFITISRYYFTYQDIDKCLAYIVIAILVVGVSWLYNKQMQQGKDIEYLEDTVQDLKFGDKLNKQEVKQDD